MPALNFKKQFAPLVATGEKKQTIRACRKDGRNPKSGQTLYLYTGMRTKGCRKIMEAECKSSEPMTIDESGVVINLEPLNDYDMEYLAIQDGFEYYYQLREFIEQTHGLPFTGYLIKW